MRKLILLAAAAAALAFPSGASADTACPTPLFVCVDETVSAGVDAVEQADDEVYRLYYALQCAGSCVDAVCAYVLDYETCNDLRNPNLKD